MLNYLNTPYLSLLSLAAFLWLAYTAQHQQQGYTTGQIEAVNALVASTQPKPHYTAKMARNDLITLGYK